MTNMKPVMAPPNPFLALVTLQFALMEGWVRFLAEGFEAYARLCDHHTKLVHHHHTNFYRLHDVSPSGADWQDHYGKRSHDVNVERV